MFQDPMYETTQAETYTFFRFVAQRYAGNNTVAFLEIFNEPTNYRGQLGTLNWNEWKTMNEDIITVIRSFKNKAIPMVAGFDWAYDLTPLHLAPINAEGIVYTTHPYSNKRSKPWEPKWEEDFGFAAADYPIVATEFGFSTPRPGGVEPPASAGYGPQILNYLEKGGMGWICWVFDPEWGPSLLKNWNYELTGAGEFFKSAAHGKIPETAAPPAAAPATAK
jgi:endoglucanase